MKPRDWHRELWDLDPDNPENNGLQNEDLIVWMRTAALPNFRKLYRRVDHSEEPFTKGLPKGNYTLDIKYREAGNEGGKKGDSFCGLKGRGTTTGGFSTFLQAKDMYLILNVDYKYSFIFNFSTLVCC